jgi:hypothetical protein
MNLNQNCRRKKLFQNTPQSDSTDPLITTKSDIFLLLFIPINFPIPIYYIVEKEKFAFCHASSHISSCGKAEKNQENQQENNIRRGKIKFEILQELGMGNFFLSIMKMHIKRKTM